MINYIEKGYGLHLWLLNQGVDLVDVAGVWKSNVADETVNMLIAEYNPWPYEKTQKLIEINESFQNAVNALTAGTTEGERNSWTIQEREAREYPNKQPVALQILANSRGIALEDLVDKVIQKSNLYQQHYFTLQGMRDKAEDVVKAMPDSGQHELLTELFAIKFGD